MTDDLTGVLMVHVSTGSQAQISVRKLEDDGWWVKGGGGLTDSVIESGDWVPFATVVAVFRAAKDGADDPYAAVLGPASAARLMHGRSPSGLTTDPSTHPWEPECDELGCVRDRPDDARSEPVSPSPTSASQESDR